MEDKKKLYRDFCQKENSLPLFVRDWWLDAVCGEMNWDVAIVENGGQVVATMPYYIKKKFNLTLLRMPPLTQTLGPWLRPSKGKYANRLSYEKGVMTALIEQLPSFDNFQQNWNYGYMNWLPFYWKGFNQTTCYTYVLEDMADLDAVWSGFQEKVRTDIRKAINRFRVVVRDNLGIEDFLELNCKTFEQQGKQIPYSKDIVRRLDAACAERGCRRIFIAEDPKGQRHAGVYIVWDENTAYYLMGGGDPDFRSSGATSLLIWEAVRHAATVTKSFNFEGSMIERIERFFRGFGAIQKPLFTLSKTNSMPLQIYFFLTRLFSKHA